MRSLGDQIREGDVLLSNHPCAGGSHLPDLTVITPVSNDCFYFLSVALMCIKVNGPVCRLMFSFFSQENIMVLMIFAVILQN